MHWNISQSAQLRVEPLQKIIKDEKKIHLGSSGVHEQVEDGKEVLNEYNCSPD
jgi:hypothetical protein